jgi:hypothetical protein
MITAARGPPSAQYPSRRFVRILSSGDTVRMFQIRAWPSHITGNTGMQSRWRLIIKLPKRCRMKTRCSDDVRSGLPFRAPYAQTDILRTPVAD